VFALRTDWNNDPDTIRGILTDHEIAATDRRVQFVTLAAYEAGGGAVRRDLFTDGDDGVFILDPILLDRLVAEKLEAEADAVRAEGWKWVAVRPSFEYSDWSDCERRHEEPLPLSPEQETELDQLVVEQKQLCDVDGLDDEQQARLAKIEGRIDELENGETYFLPEVLAMAGAVVYLDNDGDVGVRRGLVAPGDAVAEAEADDGADGAADDGDGDAANAAGGLPHSLIECLTTHRTAALAVTLSQQPKVALAAVVHVLVLDAFYGSPEDSCLEIFSKDISLKLAEGSKARELLEIAPGTWREHLPGNADDLFAWCLEQSADRLLDLLAQCAASSVNAVQAKVDRPDTDRLVHAQAGGRARVAEGEENRSRKYRRARGRLPFAGIRPVDVPMFIAAQLCGAIGATVLIRWLIPSLPQTAEDILLPHESSYQLQTYLFACVHNAGRSQMAAALFNKYADQTGCLAISAGTEPANHVHPEVVEVMREMGIDLSSSRPQRLTDDLARTASVLVTMGCGEACPFVPNLKIIDWALPDPKGQSLQAVREIRDEIHNRVKELIRSECAECCKAA
jgi:protein-tyrosine-phosphatase